MLQGCVPGAAPQCTPATGTVLLQDALGAWQMQGCIISLWVSVHCVPLLSFAAQAVIPKGALEAAMSGALAEASTAGKRGRQAGRGEAGRAAGPAVQGQAGRGAAIAGGAAGPALPVCEGLWAGSQAATEQMQQHQHQQQQRRQGNLNGQAPSVLPAFSDDAPSLPCLLPRDCFLHATGAPSWPLLQVGGQGGWALYTSQPE